MQTCQVTSSYIHFPEQIELQFYKAFRAIKQLGCDYFYFLGIDNGTWYRFCTHTDWTDIYSHEKLSMNDPLRRIALCSNFVAVPWAQVSYLNATENKIMSSRASFGIFNGITISRSFQTKKYIFALATESKEHDLARYFMLEEINLLEKFIRNCIQIFDQYFFMTSVVGGSYH